MSHQISGVIASPGLAARVARHFEAEPPIVLEQGFAFLPLDRADCALRVPQVPRAPHAFPELSEGAVVAELLACAGTERLAVIETAYFGGQGVQAAVLIGAGAVRQFGSATPGGAINAALLELGVTVPAGTHDAFDALGLGRARSNERWRERG